MANADALDVRQPATAGTLVGEADLLAEPRLFTADLATI
jgi:hypothetical protein